MNPDDLSLTDPAATEPLSANPVSAIPDLADGAALAQQKMALQRQVDELRQEIQALQKTKTQVLQTQLASLQTALDRLTQESLGQLEQRKQTLQVAVEQLERRQEKVREEMRKSFAGVSRDLAIRVQGFKDYLVNSLQDLVTVTEELDLAPKAKQEPISSRPPETTQPIAPQFAEQGFQEQAKQVRKLLDQYRTMPNYYGGPWQLRRTFEPVHAERVSNWFFTLGGRGAIRSLGSRLQNILVASAVISILRSLYGNRVRSLILANTPERLGDWRRGLQDCLGVARGDFGPDRGIVLFESPDSLAQRADRLVKEGQMPLILIDDSEEQVNLSVLQFPMWLAFAAEPQLRTARSSSFDFFE